MAEVLSNAIIDDAVAEALQLDLSFLSGPGQVRHVPFAFTACPIAPATDSHQNGSKPPHSDWNGNNESKVVS